MHQLRFTFCIVLLSLAIVNSASSENKCDSLFDLAATTNMLEGRYAHIANALDCLARAGHASDSFAVSPVFAGFFAKLHPVARVEDSSQVAQLVEYGYNAFSMMDSGAVYLTVGDADTYAAWYLQQVFGIRSDVLVVSLPYLLSTEYRVELVGNRQFRRTFGELTVSDLPLPPTTAATDSTRDSLVAIWKHHGQTTPMYFSPSCALGMGDDTNLVSIGLVFAYESPPRSSRQIHAQLLSRMKSSWRLAEAARGMPEHQIAVRNCMIQYLTTAMIEGAQMFRDGDSAVLLEFFRILDPVCSANWQFNMARYSLCTETPDSCARYLQRIRDYASAHPDEAMVRQYLDRLDER